MVCMDHAHPLDAVLTPAPFMLMRPATQTTPLVFASPHSGSNYTQPFLASARLDPASLRRSEDCFVDELFAQAPAIGAPLLAATFPRAYCDVNREAWELDPGMFLDTLPEWVNTTSARVGAGLGTLARIVATGEAIYRNKLLFHEARSRVETCWQPYHECLSALIAETRADFGSCLLIDCHSMPTSARDRSNPDIVLGDAHGTTCSARVTRFVEQQLTAMGYNVRRNDPYAGGYVTRHYGRPREAVHALQIEIARTLYMNERQFSREAGFSTLERDLVRMMRELASAAPALMATA